MREYLELGSAPYEETCAQVGQPDYQEKAQIECKRYKEQLQKQFPEAILGIKSFSHDFGSYLEVVVYYNENNVREINMAFRIEANLPAQWT